MKIAHISDLHWLDTEGATVSDFLNKRLTGGINLMAGRARKHTHDAVIAALSAIRATGCSHLVITGDLTNLALPAEFMGVKNILNKYFADSEMVIVPGNHDFYTGESAAARRFEKYMYPEPPGNWDYGQDQDADPFPFVTIDGDVAIIGLNSAQPRPWFVAAGRLGRPQLDRLRHILASPQISTKFTILALHHHLFRVLKSPGEYFRHLDDREELLSLCREYRVGMVVHGHNHDFTQKFVLWGKDGDGGTVVSEAGSCSVSSFTRDNRAGKFNIYTVEDRRLVGIDTWRYVDGAYAFWQSAVPDDIERVPLGA